MKEEIVPSQQGHPWPYADDLQFSVDLISPTRFGLPVPLPV